MLEVAQLQKAGLKLRQVAHGHIEDLEGVPLGLNPRKRHCLRPNYYTKRYSRNKLTRELHQVVDCLDRYYVGHLVEDDFHLVEGAHIFVPACDGSHLLNQGV